MDSQLGITAVSGISSNQERVFAATLSLSNGKAARATAKTEGSRENRARSAETSRRASNSHRETKNNRGLELATVRETSKRFKITERGSSLSKSLETIVQSQRFLSQLKARTAFGSTFMADSGFGMKTA